MLSLLQELLQNGAPSYAEKKNNQSVAEAEQGSSLTMGKTFTKHWPYWTYLWGLSDG